MGIRVKTGWGAHVSGKPKAGESRNPDHDLADVLVGLEPGSGGGDLVEREASVDDRSEAAVAQCRQQVGGEALGRFGALGRAAQPVADAVEVEAPLGDPVDIQLALGDA